MKQGQVKAIAMLAGERTPLLPDLPTADEQGLKDFDVSAWNAILLPKSATPAMVAKLNAAVSKALDNPALRERLDAIGLIAAAPDAPQPGVSAQVHQRRNREMGQAGEGERPCRWIEASALARINQTSADPPAARRSSADDFRQGGASR